MFLSPIFYLTAIFCVFGTHGSELCPDNDPNNLIFWNNWSVKNPSLLHCLQHSCDVYGGLQPLMVSGWVK